MRADNLQLQEFIGSRFGLERIAYRWSTHDYYTLDHAPYIGRLLGRSRHLYVATGLNGWGARRDDPCRPCPRQ